ncbi:MAG: cysteine desulfurase NifS [Lachnospiraceae bacterium]|nr:cysteine desulfurase NifS [Lachnospiraceae bacterium]
MNNVIYMDHAATTPVYPEVIQAMQPYMEESYANPSAIYRPASQAAKAVSTARAAIAERIGALPEEIYFTSGGSESDNWALFSVCEARGFKDCHIITSQIEHHAVINTCKRLEKLGVKVTYLPVSGTGLVDPRKVTENLCPETVMVSVMYANNETGTIEPVSEIGQLLREKKVLFHTDAVQALGHIPIDMNILNADMMSASAHKLGGPKGVGMLYIRKGVPAYPFIHGGAQERGRRAGTVNVPGVIGFAEAVRIATDNLDHNAEKVTRLRDRMISRILAEIPDSVLNGDHDNRLPGNVNISFKGIEGETLLILLDRAGICASSGSACSTGAIDPSHVLTAIGLDEATARGAVRFTLSEHNTPDEVDRVTDTLKEIIERLRTACR